MPKAATLKIQQWGNSLAVRIPAGVARSARFAAGMEVELAVQEVGVIVTPLSPRKLTLAEKLAQFNPAKYGGEAMVSGRVGAEAV